MPPLDVAGTTPILIVGTGEQASGEVWLSNSTTADITVTGATITVTLPTGDESGPIGLAPDAAVPAQGARRLVIEMGVHPLTPPGTFAASIELSTSAGDQSVAASVVVAATLAPVLVPERFTFEGVAPGAVVAGTVVVRNSGNVPVVVGPIADEPLLEVRAHLRALAIAAGGAVAVEPALGLAPLGTATFANDTPTIAPGSWSAVAFELTAPEDLAGNSHLRALPRIVTERFAVDLLTVS